MARRPFLREVCRVSVAIDGETYEWLEEYAYELHMSRSDLLRALIEISREGARIAPELNEALVINHVEDVRYGRKKAAADLS